MTWFWTITYSVLAVILVAGAVVSYLFYRGYKKIAAVASFNMPIGEPFTHAILGNPEAMAHPCKHLLRARICDSISSAYHQLLFSKTFMVFVNDAVEAGKVLTDQLAKGPVYTSFRLMPAVADTNSAEGPAWEARIRTLRASYARMHTDEATMTADLLAALHSAAESGKTVNMSQLFTLYALDVMCRAAFDYPLGAVSGSAEGADLLKYIETHIGFLKSSNKLFPAATGSPVTAEEEAAAKQAWVKFLQKRQAVLVSEAMQHEAAKGELDRALFGHALVAMAREMHAARVTAASAAGAAEAVPVPPLNLTDDPNILAEMHLVLRHGHEMLQAQLQWFFYTLYRHPEERAKLEKAIIDHKASHPAPSPSSGASADGPEYLECVIKEILRVRPAAANFTVRSIDKPYQVKGPDGGYVIPVQAGGVGLGPGGTPINVSIYCLQNTSRTWGGRQQGDKWHAEKFQPERWEGSGSAAEGLTASHPSCPFLARNPALSSAPSPHNAIYAGVGFKPQSLSFFPFSAGDRRCRGIDLALSILRRTALDVVPLFRLDALRPDYNEDPGAQYFTTLTPALTMDGQSSVDLLVSRATEPGVMPKRKKEKHGWAQDDSDDEDMPVLDGVQ